MDNKLTIDTRAKINLTLDIINKRRDGYHNLSMVMQTIDLFDTIDFELTGGNIAIVCNDPKIPTDYRNIIYKAAFILKEKYKVSQGVNVKLTKRIPSEAGLAGGSANGAGTLIALNRLWNLNLSKCELLNLGSQIGADIPFCITGGTALAEGIGEILTPIDNMPEFNVVLVKPPIGISTPWAYSKVRIENILSRPDNAGMIEAINNGNKKEIALRLNNVFEDFIFPHHPLLMDIKGKLKDLGALGQIMSGSGPTIYGLFDDYHKAVDAKNIFDEEYDDVFLVKTYNEIKEVNHGV